MGVLNLAREEIRFLAAEHVDRPVNDDFGGAAGRMGKRRPRYPCVDGRIVDVDARDAVWIAAANGPELAPTSTTDRWSRTLGISAPRLQSLPGV